MLLRNICYVIRKRAFTFIYDRVNSSNGLFMIFHFVHMESKLWTSVVSNQTDTDTLLTQVGLKKQIVNEILHFLEIFFADR